MKPREPAFTGRLPLWLPHPTGAAAVDGAGREAAERRARGASQCFLHKFEPRSIFPPLPEYRERDQNSVAPAAPNPIGFRHQVF